MFGGRIAQVLGGNQPSQPVNGGGNPEVARLKLLYQSLAEMNTVLNGAIPQALQLVASGKLSPDQARALLQPLEPHLKAISKELPAISDGLRRLQTGGGLISLALRGGAEQLLGNLASEVDKLNCTIVQVMQKANGGNGNGRKG